MDAYQFEKVFWAMRPRLLQYARRRVDRAGADDVVSEVFLTLWAKSLAYPTTQVAERELWALAFQVLHGHVSNELRSRRRRRALTEKLEGLRHPMSSRSDDPTIVDEQAALDCWLGRLSPTDRHVVLLINAGVDTTELAHILGCSPSAAAKRRNRARKRMRTMLDAESGAALDQPMS